MSAAKARNATSIGPAPLSPPRPVERALDQIGDSGERKLRLRATRPRREHAVPDASTLLNRVPPDGCLPDSGLALHQEEARKRVCVGEEAGDGSQLLFAADDLERGHGCLRLSRRVHGSPQCSPLTQEFLVGLPFR